MKTLKIYQAAISEGFKFYAVLPPIIFAVVGNGAAYVPVLTSWMLTR